jgi:hypothetical protein
LYVLGAIIFSYGASIVIERWTRRSIEMFVSKRWYWAYYGLSLPGYALVAFTVPAGNPFFVLGLALVGGIAQLAAQIFCGKKLPASHAPSQS